MSRFQHIQEQQQIAMKIDITVKQTAYNKMNTFPESETSCVKEAKVYLYGNEYACTPSYVFYTDDKGNISKTVHTDGKLYAQAFSGKYKSGVVEVNDNESTSIILPSIYDESWFSSNAWLDKIQDRNDTDNIKRTIYVTKENNPFFPDNQSSTLSSFRDGEGSQIIEMFANSELSFDGVALMDASVGHTSGKLSTNANVVNSTFLYSFHDMDVNKPAYVSGNSVSRVFSIHSYVENTAINAYICPVFVGDDTGLKFDGQPSNHSMGQYRCSESVSDNQWTSYVADNGNLYYSIEVTDNNGKFTQSVNLIKGYEYTFKIFTASEVDNDGIVITNTENFLAGDDSSHSISEVKECLGKCSGVRNTHVFQYIPQQDETIYMTFLSDNENIGWIDSSGAVSGDMKDTEYGEIEIEVGIPKIYEIKFHANGNPCIIGNVDTSDTDYVIGEYILKDRLKSIEVQKDEGQKNEPNFLGWGDNRENPTVIYNVDDVVDPSTLPSELYAIWENKYGYYKVKTVDDDNDVLSGVTIILYTDAARLNHVGSIITDKSGCAVFSISMSSAPEKLYAYPVLDGYVYNPVVKVINRVENQDMNSGVSIIYMTVSDDGEDAGMKSFLKERFSKLSSNHIKECINNGEDTEYDEEGYRINISDPDSVDTLDIFTSVPVIMNSENRNIIGSVDTSLKQDTNKLNIKTVNRYSGYYNPIFRDILFYENYDKNCPYSNTKFDDGYADNYGKFGMIRNMWFHKVNDERSAEIVSSLTPYYPLTGQYALDCKDYNIFASNWDMNYYTKQLDTVHREECMNMASMKNGLCMFGSKYLNTPETIEIECISGHQEWNDEWITDPNACDGEMMYKEVDRTSVKFYLFLRKRILRYFYKKLYNEFSRYINADYSYGNKGIEDDINEYVSKNILKLYKLEKIRMFIKQDKTGVHDIRIDNDYITYIDKTVDELKRKGFIETNTIMVSKVSLDDFDRQVVYNLKNGYKEDFGFSFIIKKI